ncbi:MAG: hypothetical protein MPEBLZ_04322 [Candidatus Methanoperedens nitroreducens]|uniref:Uncharacterized protein n=1 Tax=Candidatus Methanoperedens nitratireducens TaxID=1392998 RepID=A0A0N8KQ47_9EURY|nr:MAG: hypothetical protein MPEBLZ_04322 [Candidatus Methanoperedens sp. BLZ1]
MDGIVFNVNKDNQIVKKTAYVVFAVTIEGKRIFLEYGSAKRIIQILDGCSC